MERRYIKTVESNVKSPRPWRVDLYPHTILQGGYGSGKSTIIEAISLVLRRRGDDVLFKSPATGEGLIPIIGEGASALTSVLTFDDGSKATAGLEVHGDGSFSKLEVSLPPWMAGYPDTWMPMATTQERIVKGDAAALQSFLDAAGVDVTPADAEKQLLARLTKTERAVFDAWYDEGTVGVRARQATTGLGWLIFIRDCLVADVRDAQADARASERAAKEVIPLGAQVTQAELDEAEALLAWSLTGIDQLGWELVQLDAWLTDNPMLEGGDVDLDALELIEAYVEAAEHLQEYYGGDGDDLLYLPGDSIEYWRGLRDSMRADSKNATALQTHHEKSKEYAKKYEDFEQKLTEAGYSIDDYEWPTEAPESSVDVAARVADMKMRMARQALKVSSAVKGEESRQDAAVLGAIAKKAAACVGDVAATNKEALEAAITKHLPKGDRCVIATERFGKAGLFLPGIQHRDGVIGYGLSGREGNDIVAALAVATLAKINPPFACIVPPDRGRGDLQSFMHQWKDSPFQVLVTDTAAYHPSIPGWEVIKVHPGMFNK